MGEPKRYLMSSAVSPPIRFARVKMRSCVESSRLYVSVNDRAPDSSARSLLQKDRIHVPLTAGVS